jgi:hypothetical protein
MKKILFALICLTAFGFMAVAQSESSNVTTTGKHPVGSKGWTVQFAYNTIPASGSYGAESDGTYIYITKWSGDTIWKYTSAGVLVSSFKITGVTGLRDLAYDGTYFYGGANAASIYKMDFTTNTLVSTITIPSSATGVTARNICYDPINDGLWVGAWGSNLVLLNKTTGAVMQTILATNHGQTAMAGSAFDTVSPGGPYIWIITASTLPAEIHQISVATGLPTGIMHYTTDDINPSAAASGGGLFITPNLVPGTVTLGGVIQNALLFGYDLATAKADSFDLAVNSLNVPNTALTNASIQIKGVIQNKGLIATTGFNLNYSINGGTPVTQVFSGLNIAFGSTYSFTHNTPWVPTAAGSYDLKVWVSGPNGMPDADTTNNFLIKSVDILDSAVAKTVVIEEATGAWCGYCPDGAVVLNQILTNHPGNTVGVAIHNSDGMAFTDGNTVNTAYAQGYPNGYIDRVLFSDQTTVGLSRSIWEAKTVERLADLVPVLVEGNTTYNPNGKVLTIEMSAKFASAVSGDYRVNAFIIEDSVTGTGSAYNQVNNYNTVAGHTYYGAGNPIVGFKHMHVLRAMLGGPWGTSGVIPATVNKNDIFNKQFTYTIPAGVNPNRLKVVYLVQKYNSNINLRPIVNASEEELGVIDGIENHQLTGDILSIYPNPAEYNMSFDFMIVKPCEVSLEVYNIIGEKVSTMKQGNLPAGEYHQEFDVTGLAKGVYILKVDFGGTIRAEKFTVR